jgi:hypothetical protein
MNDITRTALFVGGGAALALIATFSSPGAVEPATFDDTGGQLFPEFKDPAEAAELEVWGFNADTGESLPFNVKLDKGRWTIPSHHGYPADAKTRMAKAASLLIGLTKDRFISDATEDHEKLGVVDPTDATLQLAGRGTKVTFKSAAGQELGSLIIGQEVEDRTGMRYARLPGKKRTYAVKMDFDLSTKFEDWIERDILKTGAWDIESLVFDNYSVNEASGRIEPGEKLALKKVDYEWKLDGLGEDEEINKEKVDELPRTVADAKIVGVRPKPPGLTSSLERAQGIAREILLEQLARRGYFLANDGKLYSNEGDILVGNRKGVRYTLRFGEIVYGTGEAVTSGAETKKPDQGKDPADAAVGPAKPEGSHRYLMITAEFDEALLKKPDGTPLAKEQIDKRKKAKADIDSIVAGIEKYKTAHEGKLPASLADLTSGDGPPLTELPKDPWENDYVLETRENDAFAVLSLADDKAKGGEGAAEDIASDKAQRETDLAKVFDDHEAHQKKVKEGQDEAKALSERFAPWYYVIAAESFDKLRVKRADVVKKKEKKDDAAAGDGTDKGGDK